MTRPAPFRPDTWPESVRGMPVCPKRGLPVPYIAEVAPDGTANFTILDDAKAQLCRRHRLCAMCSRPMRAEVALIGDEVSLRPDGYFIEPPVHEQCALDALGGMCPFLSGERVPRRDHSEDPTVKMVGTTAAGLARVGREIAKRPVVMAVTRTYSTGLAVAGAGTPVLIYRAGRIERARRFAYGPDGLLAEVTPPAPEPPGHGPATARTQPRRHKRRK